MVEPPPARIVLLSDGENTVGRSPVSAAQAASNEQVAISTIAYGTPAGTIQLGTERIPVPADGETLRTVATTTGGTYYEAATGDELDDVYDDIGSSVGNRQEQRDVFAWFVGIALLLGTAAATASVAWFGRLP